MNHNPFVLKSSSRNSSRSMLLLTITLELRMIFKEFEGESFALGSALKQCLSQDLETGCLKLAVENLLGVQIFKGDHNILIFQP